MAKDTGLIASSNACLSNHIDKIHIINHHNIYIDNICIESVMGLNPLF